MRDKIGKLMSRINISSCLIVYIIYTAVVICVVTKICCRRIGTVDYCIHDIFLFDEYNCKLPLLLGQMMILVIIIRNEFRTMVIMRVKRAWKIFIRVFSKIAATAFAVSILQACTVAASSVLVAVRMDCEWESYEGYPFYLVSGIVEKTDLSEIIVFYVLITFFTVTVSGTLMSLLWWLTETPAVGYVILIIIYFAETGGAFSKNIFFERITLKPANVFMNGINISDFIIYPIVVILVLTAVSIIIIKKKNYLKLH